MFINLFFPKNTIFVHIHTNKYLFKDKGTSQYMPYNTIEINTDALYDFIESIDPYCEQQLSFYALGGTALTILGLKQSTLDIDINVKTKSEYDYITKIFKSLGFLKLSPIRWQTQEGFAFDIFFGQQILGTHLLEDALQLSKKQKEFTAITIYTLNIYDIIISKIVRSDIRDLNDIKTILLQKQINMDRLTQRYKATVENSVISFAKQKYLEFLADMSKYAPPPTTIIQEVQSWQIR